MPRIDPLQLLKCLSVLLSPEGGILSRDEVPRLVNLMTKFSKKLVSKCVYVLILKNTETSLVDMFMAEGGWTLIQSWLHDAAHTGNWDLVKEILGLLLITPVDVERLKMNCLPKLIKNLSRREDLPEVSKSSDQIVQKWLSIVKGTASAAAAAAAAAAASNASSATTALEIKKEPVPVAEVTKAEVKATASEATPAEPKQQNKEEKPSSEEKEAIEPNKSNNSKQNGRKLSIESDKAAKPSDDESVKSDEKAEKQKDKSKSSSRSKSSSSRDKEREKDRKKSSSSSSKSSSSSSSRSKDDKKDKERDRKDKDKSSKSSSSSSSKSSSKSSSSSSKDKKDSKDKSKSSDSKEKEKEKEKELEKLKSSIEKLGRIPKKSSVDDKQKENKVEIAKPSVPEEKKKPAFSILNRKATGEERSKTVKVYNSKMRSTGLEEEVKPPPPRTGKKPTPSIQLPTIPPTIPMKRPSPPRELNSGMPPEKKIKIDKVDIPERPGAIKLIPPKPKPTVLLESDMFMDALLTASVPKKDAKKRKRRPSVTKDTNAPTSPSSSPVHEPPTPTSPTLATSANALGLKNIAPINFYQDTLSEVSDPKPEENAVEEMPDENKEVETISRVSPENEDTPASPSAIPEVNNEVEMGDGEVPAKQMRMDGELKGVLLYTKKKGPKRSIRWKEEEDLVEVRYFELDETERVNVTKTFMDMAKMDITSEREALIMSRKLPNEDTMEPQTAWRMLYLCEQPDVLAPPGSKSLEKDIQFAREKSTLPALYYDKRQIPDCPAEAILENHQVSDPVVIPLEDPESQEIDLRNTPWPDSKGFAPNHMEVQPMPPMFQNVPFNHNFGNMGAIPPGAPYGMPHGFPVPPGPHGPMGPPAGQFGPPNMMHNMMAPGPMNQPEMMNGPNVPMNPAGFIPGPDGYMAPGAEQNYPMPQYGGPQGPNMNMYGGHPGPNQNNFNNHRGGHGGRGGGGGGGGGGFRRGGGANNQGNWVQLNGPRNNGWKRGGGGGRGGRLCKNIQNHGYCRNGDNCPFVH